MGLTGNLRTMDLPEILQWISAGRKTGTLHLEHRSIQKRIVFKEGNIFTSTSTDPRESLGQFLLREHLLTEEQLFKTLLRQEQEGRLLGSIVVSDGVVTEEDLRRTLRTKAEETVYDLFHWPEGHFEFKDGETAKGPLIPIDLGVPAVILEGIRRVDEWQRIREVFPSMGVTLKLPRGLPEGVTEPFSLELLRHAQAGKTLAAIALELRRSEFETAVRAFALHEQGLLAVDQVEQPAARDEDPVEATRELLAEGYQRLMEKRYDKALAAYEQVLALDRLNQNAKKGVMAALEARNRERTLRTVPLHKVPVLKMELADLTREDFDPQEGFVLSRVNGQWDVQSILKLCPMKEEEALVIFARLLERGGHRAALTRAPSLISGGGTHARPRNASRPPETPLARRRSAAPSSRRSYSLRPMTGAIWRRSWTSSANISGVIDWGPSESARFGSWWTSIIRPSAPTAAAARLRGATFSRRPVPWEGSTRMGRWLRFFTAGTMARSRVFREKSENVRTPRSQKITE